MPPVAVNVQPASDEMMIKTNACRQLFGPVDHDEVASLSRRLHAEHQEAVSRRWNFDFKTMTPGKGRWEWEAIGTSKSTESPLSLPAKQQQQVHEDRLGFSSLPVSSESGCDAPSSSVSSSSIRLSPVSSRCDSARSSRVRRRAAGQLKRQLITDYFPEQKKRRDGHKN